MTSTWKRWLASFLIAKRAMSPKRLCEYYAQYISPDFYRRKNLLVQVIEDEAEVLRLHQERSFGLIFRGFGIVQFQIRFA